MHTTREQKSWTTLALIQASTTYLTDRGFEDARLNVELLLASVLRCKRIDLYLRFDQPVQDTDVDAFRALFKRRLRNEPLQYILGETEFMGFRFEVDPRVLVPRPETEHLIEEVVALSRSNPSKISQILDVGTGSGNIAIALAKLIPEVTVCTIDASRDALELAKKNVALYDVGGRVVLKQMDFLDTNASPGSGFDLLVSNPPYVPRGEFETLQPEVRMFEPSHATTDNADGLTFYRAIAARGKELVRQGGWVAVEIGFGQVEEISAIFVDSGLTIERVVSDYNRIPRVVVGRIG